MKKILTFLLIFIFAVTAVSCGECTEHTDADGDGLCDECGSAVPKEPCTECTDSDGDGKCDVCGDEVETEKKPCTECTDADGDGKCDECGSDVNADEPVKAPTEIELPRDEF